LIGRVVIRSSSGAVHSWSR